MVCVDEGMIRAGSTLSKCQGRCQGSFRAGGQTGMTEIEFTGALEKVCLKDWIGWLQWLIPVILMLWKVVVGRLIEARNSRTAWETWLDPHLHKK